MQFDLLKHHKLLKRVGLALHERSKAVASCFCTRTEIHYVVAAKQLTIKGATSGFVNLEKFSQNFSSLSFAIRVNLLRT